MWTALVRQIAVFLITRRGKRVIAFAGAFLLCFTTALLIDSRMYLTAGFTGALAAAALVAFVIQYFRQRTDQRERIRQDAEEAVRRAAAAQARNEKFDKAKSTVADAARSATSSAANIADRARKGISGARDRLSSWRTKK